VGLYGDGKVLAQVYPSSMHRRVQDPVVYSG